MRTANKMRGLEIGETSSRPIQATLGLKLVLAECVRQRNEGAIKLGIISPPPLSLSLSHHLLNLQERVVVGFPNFAWASN
jgi:hypothetical protein